MDCNKTFTQLTNLELVLLATLNSLDNNARRAATITK